MFIFGQSGNFTEMRSALTIGLRPIALRSETSGGRFPVVFSCFQSSFDARFGGQHPNYVRFLKYNESQ
jgi:hypothetical protein